jgi:hypothetical protein
MGMITLLKHFTYAAANGGGFSTDWVRIPEEYQNWQLVVIVHSRISTTTASVQLATTWDTATATNIGSSASLATVGVNQQDITSGMGPMVRLNFSATADSAVTLSVYLTPKST